MIITIIQKNKLKNDHVITEGFIYDMGSSYKSGERLFFNNNFKVNVRIFGGNSGVNCSRQKRNELSSLLVRRTMPVVYEKGNPDNCEMLFDRRSFNKYNVDIPQLYITVVDSIESICLNAD